MLKWKVGRVAITRIVELEVPIGYDQATPFMRDAKPGAFDNAFLPAVFDA